MNNLDDGAECLLSKFADDTKPGGVADAPDGHTAIQRHLDRLEKWAERKFMELSTEKYKVLCLGRNNPMLQSRLGAKQLDSSFVEGGPGCPGGPADHKKPAMLPHGKED